MLKRKQSNPNISEDQITAQVKKLRISTPYQKYEENAGNLVDIEDKNDEDNEYDEDDEDDEDDAGHKADKYIVLKHHLNEWLDDETRVKAAGLLPEYSQIGSKFLEALQTNLSLMVPFKRKWIWTALKEHFSEDLLHPITSQGAVGGPFFRDNCEDAVEDNLRCPKAMDFWKKVLECFMWAFVWFLRKAIEVVEPDESGEADETEKPNYGKFLNQLWKKECCRAWGHSGNRG